jgi:hypothetical protein
VHGPGNQSGTSVAGKHADVVISDANVAAHEIGALQVLRTVAAARILHDLP